MLIHILIYHCITHSYGLVCGVAAMYRGVGIEPVDVLRMLDAAFDARQGQLLAGFEPGVKCFKMLA